MTIFCTECGKQAIATSRFCVGCGSPLHLATGEATSQQIRPDLSAPSAPFEPFGSGQYLAPISNPSVTRRPARSQLRTILLSVGALLTGVTIGLAGRELGVFDFALGEKIAVGTATEQARTAYESGYRSGETEGTKSGDEAGYARGLDDGYDQGLQEGETTGYERGYLTGLDVGFIDAKTGITPTDLGDLKLSAEWTTNIGNQYESGICFFSDGLRLSQWQQMKWAFISSSGSIKFLSDSNDDYNCFTESEILRRVGSIPKYTRLAIYVTANGKSDRWGPSPTPTP